jgi:hypothetical protein
MEGVAVQEQFDEMVALYRPRIFRFALASLRDRDAAETVTQDCFLRAYKAWPGFRGDSSVHSRYRAETPVSILETRSGFRGSSRFLGSLYSGRGQFSGRMPFRAPAGGGSVEGRGSAISEAAPGIPAAFHRGADTRGD